MFMLNTLLHIKVRLPVLLCAVKTVEGDFRFCWTITRNVGQTHKENPNLVRIIYMLCTLNDIYKQYNTLHEHWYTKISSLRCVEDRNPPQNTSDLYMKYWSYAEHCRPCTRLSGVNWWKKKIITLIVPIGYSLFADHRSVPSFGPWCFRLTYFYLWLAQRGSTVGFLLLQCSSGVVRQPRDLQVSVTTRFCRVLIFASSQYLSVIYLFHVLIHWWVRKPPRGPNNCMFWAMIEAEGEVGYP